MWKKNTEKKQSLPSVFADVNFMLVPDPDSDLASLALAWRDRARSDELMADSAERNDRIEDARVLRLQASVRREAGDLVLGGADRSTVAGRAAEVMLAVPGPDPVVLGTWHNLVEMLTHEPKRHAQR